MRNKAALTASSPHTSAQNQPIVHRNDGTPAARAESKSCRHKWFALGGAKPPVQNSLALENGAIVVDRHKYRRAELALVRTPIDSRPTSSYSQTTGWVAEWFKAPVLKTGVRETVPGVRIPPQPLIGTNVSRRGAEDAVIGTANRR
jgi:hypothetical protein